jgi:hypothetical protein
MRRQRAAATTASSGRVSVVVGISSNQYSNTAWRSGLSSWRPRSDRGGDRRGAPSGGSGFSRRRAAAADAHGHHAELARRAWRNEGRNLPALLTEALGQAEQATDELRGLAHGILPAVLIHGGLRAGVAALPARMNCEARCSDRRHARIDELSHIQPLEAMLSRASVRAARRVAKAAVDRVLITFPPVHGRRRSQTSLL